MTTAPADLLSAALWLGEAAALLYVAYRCSLAFLSFRRREPAPADNTETNFLVLVSAHNEEAVIGATVANLSTLDYPAAKRSVIVLADDCSDGTEAAARAGGAVVINKPGPARGKGRVIEWALAQPEVVQKEWDALVLFDADSRPASNFLKVVSGAIQAGARVVQGRDESGETTGWIARGYRLNSSQRNRTWHLAREMAGFGAALTGTGVCVTREVLETTPPRTTTLTEDLEYSAILARAGVRAHYIYDAVVLVEQPHSLRSSVHQRLRWARGQIQTTLMHAPALIWRGLVKREFSSLDLALYLGLPSLTPIQAGFAVWLVGSAAAPGHWPNAEIAGLPRLPDAILLAALPLTLLVAYLGLLAERRSASWRDWLAFGLLMVSWLPIAVVAAFTTYVRSWHRTPHGVPGAAAVPGRREPTEPAPPEGRPASSRVS
jgi:cellulose synthase/poly-beta-1,6-N-acetylglucosamine synthase-like glycosyltransferase